jgi:hypothetical protein
MSEKVNQTDNASRAARLSNLAAMIDEMDAQGRRELAALVLILTESTDKAPQGSLTATESALVAWYRALPSASQQRWHKAIQAMPPGAQAALS